MGCLYLEIEGQSCFVGSVDQGLVKNRQFDPVGPTTKKDPEKKKKKHFFPIATLPGIFPQITPKKVWKLFGQTIGFLLSSVQWVKKN